MFNLKNALIAVLALAAVYLGWMRFAVADSPNTFSIQNTAQDLQFTFDNCTLRTINVKASTGTTTIADTTGATKTEVVTDEIDCKDGEIIKGLQIDKDKDSSGNDVMKIDLNCCTINVSANYHN
jgi:hypothetical protein